MSDRIQRPRPLADGVTTRPVDRARFRSVVDRRLARPVVRGHAVAAVRSLQARLAAGERISATATRRPGASD